MRIIGDRIEAATYLLAAAASNGAVKVKGFDPRHLGNFLPLLADMNLEIQAGNDQVCLKRNGSSIKPLHVATGPFPELATDLQAPLMALLTMANGESTIEENVFEGRFGHVSELCRMGAQITVEDRSARVTGVEALTAAPVEAFDIRGAASLVIAATAAEGATQIHSAHHLERGYADLPGKLRSLGGCIGIKVTDPEDYIFTGC